MANKRIIQSAIFEDEFFGELSFFERLLWIGIFTRCADDQGRMLDNPIIIRSQVFPYDDIQAKDINTGLEVFNGAGKITRYTVQGKKYIQIVKWFDNQQPQWAMPSKYPAPPNWKDRVRSYIKGVYNCENWPEKRQPNTPPEPEIADHLDTPPGESTLPVQVTGHEINPNPILNPTLVNNDNEEETGGENIFTLYESEIGMITPLISDKLQLAEKEYPVDWIKKAFGIATANNARNWNYIEVCLKNMKTKGVDWKPNGNGKKSAPTEPGLFAVLREMSNDGN